MTPGIHRVRRQSWRLRVAAADAAFAVRARFRSEVEDLLPAFHRAFDAWAPGEAVVHIPRLELRLRIASLDQLAGALHDAIGRELPPYPPAQPRAVVASELELLLGYLESGTLAWHAAQCEPADAAAQLCATLLANLKHVVQRAPVGDAALERAVAFYFRLLQLLPEEKWPELAVGVVAEAAPRSVSDGAAAQAAFAALLGARALLGRYRAQRLAAAVLASVRSPASSRQAPGDALASILGVALDAVEGAMPCAAAPPSVATRLVELPGPAASFFAARLGLVSAAAESAPREDRPPPRDTEPGFDRRRSDTPLPESQPFAFLAGNAGLVLLHPFLPRLFENCGLYEAGRGLRDALPPAAALLHWLATGREEIHEFELGFVKLLLGLHPETPLAAGAGLLGARERDEGEGLLRAVISHWTALKGTSIEGLRMSFLQRRGALREEETGWRLQLEPESFDVLLNQLPWGIATVKLPWMTRPLFTDWPTP